MKLSNIQRGVLMYVSFLIILIIGVSCEKDDTAVSPPAVALNFTATDFTVQENNTDGLEIKISFVKPTTASGSVTIAYESDDAAYDTDFTTSPEGSSGIVTVDIPSGSTSSSFTILPITIAGENQTKIITFKLKSGTGGVDLGAKSSITVAITDEPIITVIDAGDITDFGNIEQTLTSSSQSYKVTATSLIENVTVIAETGFEVSSDDSFFDSMIDLDAATLNEDTLTVFVRFAPAGGEATGAKSATITHSSSGAADQSFSVSGTADETTALITLQESIDDFGVIFEGDTAQIQSYDVEAQGLTDTLWITVPAPFAISLDGITFSNAEFILAEAINNSSQEIWVLFTATAEGVFAGDITHSSAGATDQTQALTGEVIRKFETIVVQGRIDPFSAFITQTSASQNYTLSGTDLVEDVIVTAPDQFEISEDDATYSSMLTLDYTMLNSAEKTIYVRFSPDENPGSKSGNVTHTSGLAPVINIALSGIADDVSFTTVAFTSFEEPMAGTGYTDLVTNEFSHDLVNNVGDASIEYTSAGGEMGWDATLIASRLFGSPNGLADEPIGVTQGLNDGLDYTDGIQGYRLEDTDAVIRLTFDLIDISTFDLVIVSMDMFIKNSTYEVSTGAVTGLPEPDRMRVYVIGAGGEEVDLFNKTAGDAADDLNDSIKGVWSEIRADISGLGSATLVIEVDTNFNSEGASFDNVKILGATF